MPTYDVRGVHLHFPHEAYECQLVYMERVIEALDEKKHALLESPTGTGKTLCLLCATLAWREKYVTENPQEEPPRIVYSSRTHAQLQQVIQELKNTPYRPRMTILGSRNQMCINQEARKADRGGQLNMICGMLRKSKRCSYGARAKEVANWLPGVLKEPFDIEDIVNMGKEHKACPYFVTREWNEGCEVSFMPYNYLLDQRNRKGINLGEDTILILDEAHNVEAVCCEASSFDLNSNDLMRAIGDAEKCIQMFAYDYTEKGRGSKNNFTQLKTHLVGLEKAISRISEGEEKFTRDGSYIHEFFASPGIGINHHNVKNILQVMEEAEKLLTGIAEEEGGLEGSFMQDEEVEGGRPTADEKSTAWLTLVKDCLSFVFREDVKTEGIGFEARANPYKFHVHAEYNEASKRKVPTLSYWCFDPGLAMKELAKAHVRSIFLTSGTLSPLDTLASELALKFPVRLENPHVIEKTQILAGVLPVGPSNGKLNSSFKHRSNDSYKSELGNAIVNIARVVPHGLLVFFPSYNVLSSCVDAWKMRENGNASIWERITKLKYPVVEPRNSVEYSQASTAFRTWVEGNHSKGAIFFAVCRGKVSEGMDFSDRAGRAVVITGVPYAMRHDPKVCLKREYLDKKCGMSSNQNTPRVRGNALSGEAWYTQEAFRAVNQAVGRVIRHRNDYGAIIYADERFANSLYREKMSLWLRPHLQIFPSFGSAASSLSRFFRMQETSTVDALPPAKRLASMSVMLDNFQGGSDIPSNACNQVNTNTEIDGHGCKIKENAEPSANIAGLSGLARKAAFYHSTRENAVKESTLGSNQNSLVRILQTKQRNSSHKLPSSSHFKLSEQLQEFETQPLPVKGVATHAHVPAPSAPDIHVSRTSKGGEGKIAVDTKAFLATAKAALSSDGLQVFKQLILNFKTEGKSPESFGRFMKYLLDLLQREDALDLLQGLACFIPQEFKDDFKRLQASIGIKNNDSPPQQDNKQAEHLLPASSGRKSTCIVCTGCIENAHAAPCGHTACFSCWRRILQRPEQRKCPMCGARVDRSNLTKKFFV